MIPQINQRQFSPSITGTTVILGVLGFQEGNLSKMLTSLFFYTSTPKIYTPTLMIVLHFTII